MKPIYKLIPYPLNEGEWLIISDEKLTTVENNTYYLSNRVLIKTELFEGNIVQRQSKGATMDICISEIENIISSTKLIDKSIPLIRREQLIFPDGFEIVLDSYWKDLSREEKQIARYFYNKHAETHPITHFDVKILANRIADFCKNNYCGEEQVQVFTESWIQSQPKKEYIIELEMEYYSKSENGHSAVHEDQRPKVDKEGYINILSIK